MNKNVFLVGLLALVTLALGITILKPNEVTQGPRGERGEKGEVGLQGPRGLQGPQGLRGLQGLSGEAKLGAMSGPTNTNELNCILDYCTWTKQGVFVNATTSLASIRNPFGATSTGSFRVIDIFGLSTTTLTLNVGTSTSAFGTVASTSKSLLSNYEIATGTLVTILPGMSSGAVGAASGYQNNGIGTTTSVVLGPTDYLAIYGQRPEAGTNDNGGILGNSNTFQGRYVLEFRRLMK